MHLLASFLDPLPESGYGLPRDVSADGHRIDWLIQVTLISIAILFAIMVAWMLWSCFRHGRKHEAAYTHGDSRRAKLLPLGIAAFVFVVVDGNLFYHSTRDMHEVFWNFAHAESQPDAVKVEVFAHQWCWDFRYPGADGTFGTPDDPVVLNELRVPLGAPVIIQMASQDVIHSFYLPNYRVKMDVVPGTLSKLWFRPTQLGEYDIGCAQHCGTNHYKMRGKVIVMPPDEYKAWMATASRIAEKSYVETDEKAHWGWTWKEEGK